MGNKCYQKVKLLSYPKISVGKQMLSKNEALKLLKNVRQKCEILRCCFLFFLYQIQFPLEVVSHHTLFLLSISQNF